jgi:hypothetical protein
MQQRRTQPPNSKPLPHPPETASAAPIAPPAPSVREYSIELVPFKEYRNSQEYVSGHKWDVIIDGDLLLKASKNPEFEACRALVAKGLAGKLTTYRDGRPAMTLDIEKAAKVTVRETKALGPRFARYLPFPADTVWHFEPRKEGSGTPAAEQGGNPTEMGYRDRRGVKPDFGGRKPPVGSEIRSEDEGGATPVAAAAFHPKKTLGRAKGNATTA